ncbi:proline-rich protein 2-like isoform X1 [Dama dama]|uniref:proline-rich protein 2-like isoform X1 n=1 Tax=Dama dama TaxID=30532 RepID=UPI002A361D8E|nr:proline-rich protein 2-like isoform X1 [Dama dama]
MGTAVEVVAGQGEPRPRPDPRGWRAGDRHTAPAALPPASSCEKRWAPGTPPPAFPHWAGGRDPLGHQGLPPEQPLQQPPPSFQEALCGPETCLLTHPPPTSCPPCPMVSLAQHLWLSGEGAGGSAQQPTLGARMWPGRGTGPLLSPHRLLFPLQGWSWGDTAGPRGVAGLETLRRILQPRCLPARGLWLVLPPGPPASEPSRDGCRGAQGRPLCFQKGTSTPRKRSPESSGETTSTPDALQALDPCSIYDRRSAQGPGGQRAHVQGAHSHSGARGGQPCYPAVTVPLRSHHTLPRSPPRPLVLPDRPPQPHCPLQPLPQPLTLGPQGARRGRARRVQSFPSWGACARERHHTGQRGRLGPLRRCEALLAWPGCPQGHLWVPLGE